MRSLTEAELTLTFDLRYLTLLTSRSQLLENMSMYSLIITEQLEQNDTMQHIMLAKNVLLLNLI